MGAALMTMGLAGLIIGTGPLPFAGGVGAAPNLASGPVSSMLPGPSVRESGDGLSPKGESGSTAPADLLGSLGPMGTDAANYVTPEGAATDAAATAAPSADLAPARGGLPSDPGRTWLPALSGAFLLVGLSLLVLRGLAVRLG